MLTVEFDDGYLIVGIREVDRPPFCDGCRRHVKDVEKRRAHQRGDHQTRIVERLAEIVSPATAGRVQVTDDASFRLGPSQRVLEEPLVVLRAGLHGRRERDDQAQNDQYHGESNRKISHFISQPDRESAVLA